ncbi:MAG: TonB-dependent receptor, partial [Chitinophagaceae bacterium]|nr:TonB-dependent receptor [Chitinophagaceae bacterium]
YASTDPFQANLMRDRMQQDINLRQVNWDYLYTANLGNRETIQNADGIPGNNVSGLRSRYIVEERVIGSNRFNFNTVLNKNVNEHFDLTAGLNHLQMRNHYYKRVDDLLGGDFYVNLNQFAERDFPNNPAANQFDADRPNRILRQGDRFGYDYDMHVQRTAAWVQGVFKFRRIDYFLSAEGSQTSFFRQGNVRTGIYPNNSLGKSTVNRFTNYAVKSGLTFKIDGRNYIYANAAMLTKAPYFENIYIAPRTRDFQQQSPRSTTVRSAEAGYVLNAPKVKVRLTGYVTKMEDDYNVLSFYHDDYRNFVNYALSNIDRLHFGGELGTEVKVTSSLSVNAAAALGRYYYTSRQEAVVTLDNSNTLLGNETIYSQNFRVPATPQEAFSMGLNYRSPKFWYLSLTGNYFRQMWLDFNPIRRTSNAVDGLEYKGETFNAIIDQTSWDPQYTVDLFAGYSWKLPKKLEIDHKSTFLVFNLGVNNLLDNRKIITGGFEQLRFDFADKDPGKFPPRIFYGYGLNMFASATLRF